MSGSDGDDSYRVGRGRPPKHSRFTKGRSGNPNGRPRKAREYLIPGQLRKDVLRVMQIRLNVKMPDGEQKLTVREAVLFALAKRAMSGDKVSYMKLWLQMQKEALDQNVAEHPELHNIALFEALAREHPDEEAYVESMKALVRKSKGLD